MNEGLARGGVFLLIGSGTFSTEALDVLYDLRWMLILIAVLIVTDLWFGVSESRKRKIPIRLSRAGRRTCNKLIDYFAYLFFGAIMGMAIFEPLGIASHTTTAAISLGFGCIWEVDSIVGHICALHGVTNKLSIKKFIICLIRKRNKDVGDAIEEALEEDDKKQN